MNCLRHGDKTDAVIQACNRFGLNSNVRVVQVYAAELLKKGAIALKKCAIEHYETEIEFLTYMIKNKKGNRQTHARELVRVGELCDKATAELLEIKTITNPESWIGYQVTVMARKNYQYKLNRVYDCRTYKGQPARDIRSAIVMRKAV